MTDPHQKGQDVKDEWKRYEKLSAEKRAELQEKQKKHKEGRIQERAASEERAHEFIAETEAEAIRKKAELKVWKKKKEEQRAAIEADKRKKIEFEKYQKEQKEKRDAERKQKMEYMRDLSNSNRQLINVERRKKDAERTELELKQAADREAYQIKQKAVQTERMTESAIQKESREKRSKTDNEEVQLLAEIEQDAQRDRRQLDALETAQLQQLQMLYTQREAQVNSIQDVGIRQRESQRLANAKRADEDRVRAEFTRKKNDKEVSVQRRTLEVRRQMRLKRDNVSKDERTRIQKAQTEKTLTVTNADREAAQKRKEAEVEGKKKLLPADEKKSSL